MADVAWVNSDHSKLLWCGGSSQKLRTNCCCFTITTKVSPADGGTVTSGGCWDKGTTHKITASPNTGYKFSKWKEDGDTNRSRTITVNGNATYTAVFSKVTCGDYIMDKPFKLNIVTLKGQPCLKKEGSSFKSYDHPIKLSLSFNSSIPSCFCSSSSGSTSSCTNSFSGVTMYFYPGRQTGAANCLALWSDADKYGSSWSGEIKCCNKILVRYRGSLGRGIAFEIYCAKCSGNIRIEETNDCNCNHSEPGTCFGGTPVGCCCYRNAEHEYDFRFIAGSKDMKLAGKTLKSGNEKQCAESIYVNNSLILDWDYSIG